MENRRMLVISGLKPVLSDPNPKVQEALNHIAVVLARLGTLLRRRRGSRSVGLCLC